MTRDIPGFRTWARRAPVDDTLRNGMLHLEEENAALEKRPFYGSILHGQSILLSNGR